MNKEIRSAISQARLWSDVVFIDGMHSKAHAKLGTRQAHGEMYLQCKTFGKELPSQTRLD